MKLNFKAKISRRAAHEMIMLMAKDGNHHIKREHTYQKMM